MKKGIDYTGVSVVYFCHDGAGQYVFNKRSIRCRDEHGTWDCGGGALELGERVDAAIAKEVKEEYGVEPIEVEFLGYRDVHRESAAGYSHWITLDFKVHVDRSKVINGEPHKFDAIGWFSLDALPSPLHSQMPTALAQYREAL